jgi:hypothetical protein
VGSWLPHMWGPLQDVCGDLWENQEWVRGVQKPRRIDEALNENASVSATAEKMRLTYSAPSSNAAAWLCQRG